MSETLRPTGVHKIGGKNMRRLDEVKALIEHLKTTRERIVLVVSAFTGVTTALIKALDDLHEKKFNEASIDAAFTPVKELHDEVIRDHFKDDSANQAQTRYLQEYETLRRTLMNHKAGGSAKLTPEEGSYAIRDQVIGFGEKMGAAFLKIYLGQEGYEAHHFDNARCKSEKLNGGLVTDQLKLQEAIQDGLAEAVETAGETREEVIRIFGGHIAGTPRGNIPHEGRNYTDGRAVDVALALKRKGENIKEVIKEGEEDGVMTANPKELEDDQTAHLHPHVSHIEGLEMAAAGSGLMTTGALSRARRHGLTLVLKNINNRTGKKTVFSGTKVTTERVFKTIVSNPHVDRLIFKVPEMADHEGFLGAITQTFARHHVNIMASPDEGTSMTFYVPMPPDETDRAEYRDRIQAALTKLKSIEIEGNQYSIPDPGWSQGGFAGVAVIGNELKKQPDPSVISGALPATGIVTADTVFGGTKTRMFFAVAQESRLQAVRWLHRIFVDGDEKAIKQYLESHARRLADSTATYKG